MDSDWQKEEDWESSYNAPEGHISFRTGKSDEDSPEELPVSVQQEIDDLCYYVPEVTSHFSVLDKIGEGSFSSVFLAGLKHHKDVKQRFALKHIIPTSHPNRVYSELKCLQLFGGKENVMGLEMCLKNRDHIVIIMRFFPHQKFADYYNKFDVCNVRDYMKNLLTALRHIHRFDVIHRDIKPNNFLHNPDSNKYALVDFGLAQDAPVKLKKENENKPPFISVQNSKKKQKQTSSPPKSQQAMDQSSSTRRPALSTSLSRSRGRQRQKQLQETGVNEDSAAAVPPAPPVIESPDPALSQQSPPKSQMSKRKKGDRSHNTSVPQSQSANKQNAYSQSDACGCYGRPTVCAVCSNRPVETAQRAGTPGFRAPEVLMKHPQQSTAVDIWAAGIIFLSLLSGRYPFFHGNDDLLCLSQILSLLGTNKVREAAMTFEKLVTCQPETQSLDLKSLCTRLRSSPDTKQWPEMPDSAIDLLYCLLDPNPASRITAEKAMSHPFISQQ